MSPLRIPFWKLQSIGNDFPLVHTDDLEAAVAVADQEAKLESGLAIPPQATKECSVPPEVGLAASPTDPATADLSLLARRICDRNFGVGGDGLLAVRRLGEGLVELRMFNPDGTEDFCGNGLRCAAVHVHKLGWVGNEFTLRHLGRDVPTRIGEGHVTTQIGQADYTPDKVPVTGGEVFDSTVWSGIDAGMPLSLFGSVLSTGSTHAIIPTSILPDDDTFASVSAKIEVDPKFPQRTSVIWRQQTGPMQLKIRIWERGVGETLGCGTGSSAAAADFLRRKGGGGTVEVENPGGTLRVSMDAWNRPISVEGVAEEVYEGEYLFDRSA